MAIMTTTTEITFQMPKDKQLYIDFLKDHTDDIFEWTERKYGNVVIREKIDTMTVNDIRKF